MKNVILAYSGGLDTSYCIVYLSKIKNLKVHAVTVNTGGFDQNDIKELEQKARHLGVASFTCLDETANYYNQVLRYLIYGNVLKNNTYPLSVSAERVNQALSIAEFAKKNNADFVAHGSTGAGNDQVRFDLFFNILIPYIEILTPIRDQKLSRQEEIDFLKQYDFHLNFEKAAYSINKGLWGTSVGGKETLQSREYLPEQAFPTAQTENNPQDIVLHFTQGELFGVNEQVFQHPIEAIKYLSKIAAPYGIGRDIHVGDTIIGIKGRVGFEAAAPLIIIKAHHLLEKHVLSKWQLFLKDYLATWYGNWLHEGQFLEPAMRDIETFFKDTQKFVTGKVFVKLAPFRFTLCGIESKHDLMSSKFGSYGEQNKTWDGADVKGFTKMVSNATSIFFSVNELKNE
ncbi:MAG: argininosuccinate synthase [Sediminibacterium sp.]|nr:argininosuccinate synthase [Sediminibacterium sp.]